MVKKKNFYFELDFFFRSYFFTQQINQSDFTKDTKWLISSCVIKIIPKAYFNKFFLEPQKTIVDDITLALICSIQSLLTPLSLDLNKRIKNKRLSARDCKWFYVHLWLVSQSSVKIINFHY